MNPLSSADTHLQTATRAMIARERRQIIVSPILPGVKASILGDALATAYSADVLQSDATSTHGKTPFYDSLVHFWACASLPRPQILHFSETFYLWKLFPRQPWIILLGNPLWRALDTYRNIAHNPRHPLHAAVEADGLSLAEFYASPVSLPVRNRQARKMTRVTDDDHVDLVELLENATRTLASFAWIGLEGIHHGPQPRLGRLFYDYGFGKSLPTMQRQTRKAIRLDAPTLQALETANQVDFRLWKITRRRLWTTLFTGRN